MENMLQQQECSPAGALGKIGPLINPSKVWGQTTAVLNAKKFLNIFP